MSRHINIIGVIIFSILGLSSLGFSAEEITITTYYPSPYGSYNELTTTGNTYLATSSSGKVGIGTISPSVKLTVQAPSRADATIENIAFFYKNSAWQTGVLIRGNNTETWVSGASNSGLSPSTDLILASQLNGVPKEGIRILPNGNVGIGTANPWFPLHVQRDGPARILLSGTNIDRNNPASEFNLYDSNTRSYWNLVNEQRYDTGTAASDFFIWHSPNGVGWYPRFVINDQGNVGIGRTPTTDRLEVEGSARLYVSSAFPCGFNIERSGTGATAWSMYSPSNSTDWRLYNLNRGDIVIVTAAGNVGIGTAAPNSKLDVAGYIQVLARSSGPPPSECNQVSEYGRMVVVTGGNRGLYVCLDNGWYEIKPGMN